MAKQEKEERYKIPYLRDIDTTVKTAKYLSIGSLIFSLTVIITSMVLFKQAIIKQKQIPLVMDKNGEIRKMYDIYNDGGETVAKKALVERAHELFFRLEPDEKQIYANMQQSFYLGDFRPLFEFYQSQNYYNNLVQRNTIQYIRKDSIVFYQNLGRYYGKELIRGQGGATIEKYLVTEFEIVVKDATDNNLSGFYMDKIKIIKNNLVSEESSSTSALNSINALKPYNE